MRLRSLIIIIGVALLGTVFLLRFLGTLGPLLGGGERCADAFAMTSSRLRPGPDRSVESPIRPHPGGGLVDLRWTLETGVWDTTAQLHELDGWIAYVDSREVSRIDGDGSIRWTRSVPSWRTADMGDDLIGSWGMVGDRWHLAIIDADGALVRCDEIGEASAGIVGDGRGGYVTAGPTSFDPDSPEPVIDVVTRIEPDGTRRWQAELADGPKGLTSVVHIGDGLTVVARPEDRGGPMLAAFDDGDGRLRWAIDADHPDIAPIQSIAGIVDGRIYVVLDPDGDGIDHRVLAVDAATGTTEWSTPMDRGWDAGVDAVDDAVVVRTSTRAVAVDPASGRVLWSVDSGLLGADRQLASPRSADDRLLLPVAGGLLIDLRTGRWGRLLDEARSAEYVAVATIDDRLIVKTEVRPTDGSTSFHLSGWAFDPEAATLERDPSPIVTG